MNAASTSLQIEASPATPSVRSIELTGPAGRLEAVFNQGAPDAAYAALVCHPHPSYGGNLHNKVVYHAMKVFNDPEWGFRWPVLRFNFRGTGLSEGTHDGKAETGDVAAALDWLRNEINRPIVLAGFSFGSAMALWTCCGSQNDDKNVRAVAALGLPTQADDRQYHYSFLRNASPSDANRPKLFLSGDRDEFAPTAQLAEVVASAAEPKQLVLIPGADHFFTGQLQAMQQALAGWLEGFQNSRASCSSVNGGVSLLKTPLGIQASECSNSETAETEQLS